MAAWAPLVPFVQTRAGLGNGALGLLLLCLGGGSMVAMPLTGALAGRFGCRLVIVCALVLVCAVLPVLASASSLIILVPALLVFGAAIGSGDCTMNIQAVIVERASLRPMMSGFHGLFSLGAIAGAGGVSALLAAGAGPLAAILAVVAILLAAIWWARPHLLPYAGAGDALRLRDPTRRRAGHWRAVVRHVPDGGLDPGLERCVPDLRARHVARLCRAGLCRVLRHHDGRAADRGCHRAAAGAPRVIALGGVCAAAGLAFAVFVPSWQAGLLGYALLGAGCSNIVPVLFTAAGRQTTMPEHVAVPTIAMLGYAGILAGPAAIGLLAQVTTLPIALLIVAAMLLGGCRQRADPAGLAWGSRSHQRSDAAVADRGGRRTRW